MSRVVVVSAAIEPRLRLSLVASEPIGPGEDIFACDASEETPERTWRTIQLDAQRHLKNDFMDYVDHSCDPNAVFDVDRLVLVSLRPIDAGEAITFFYPGSEVELAHSFACTCGNTACIGQVRGGFYLTAQQMRWAMARGYCTRFMEAQFSRLLQLHAPV